MKNNNLLPPSVCVWRCLFSCIFFMCSTTTIATATITTDGREDTCKVEFYEFLKMLSPSFSSRLKMFAFLVPRYDGIGWSFHLRLARQVKKRQRKTKEKQTVCHLNELKWHRPWIKHQFWDLTKVVVKVLCRVVCNGDTVKESSIPFFSRVQKPFHFRKENYKAKKKQKQHLPTHEML